MQIVCSACGAINRVAEAKPLDLARCGQCKQALLTPRPIELTKVIFDRLINKTSLPVLVDFWAAWCAPCKMMVPVLETLARHFGTRVHVGKLDTEQEPEIAARYGIRSIPTLLLFHNGKEIARQIGAVDASALTNWVETHAPHSSTH